MGLNASYHYGILLLNRNKNIVLSAPSLQVDEYGNKLYSFRCFLATQMPQYESRRNTNTKIISIQQGHTLVRCTTRAKMLRLSVNVDNFRQSAEICFLYSMYRGLLMNDLSRQKHVGNSVNGKQIHTKQNIVFS